MIDSDPEPRERGSADGSHGFPGLLVTRALARTGDWWEKHSRFVSCPVAVRKATLYARTMPLWQLATRPTGTDAICTHRLALDQELSRHQSGAECLGVVRDVGRCGRLGEV